MKGNERKQRSIFRTAGFPGNFGDTLILAVSIMIHRKYAEDGDSDETKNKKNRKPDFHNTFII